MLAYLSEHLPPPLQAALISFDLLILSSWVVGGTLAAIVTYGAAASGQGDTVDVFSDFIVAYYRHVFMIFLGPVTFAIPSFDFDLSIVITWRPYEGTWIAWAMVSGESSINQQRQPACSNASTSSCSIAMAN